jgi:prolyl oligopeptidase
MLRYPHAPTEPLVESPFGKPVSDPWRVLEDPDDARTRAWVEAQNVLSDGWLKECPHRERMKARLTELWSHPRMGLPLRRGGLLFHGFNSGLQNQSVLRVSPSLDVPGRVLLDPNEMRADGTVSLQSWSPSRDGKLLAYALASGGSDWLEWRIRDVATGEDLPDVLRWCKWSGASWLKDGSGFFYSRYDAPPAGKELEGSNAFHKLYLHRVGTAQEADELVHESRTEPEWMFDGYATPDGQWLIITVSRGTDPTSLVLVKDLQLGGPVRPLIGEWRAEYSFVGHVGRRFLFKTDHHAPLGKVVTLDVDHPELPEETLIPQDSTTLVGVSRVGDALVCNRLRDAHSEVTLHGLDGALRGPVALPGLGSVSGLGGRLEDGETWFSYTSFTTPSEIHRLDTATGKTERVWGPKVPFDPAAFEARQVFFESNDGTRVPMFICHRRGLVLDGSHPTYLYGYGGFSISLTPAFSIGVLTWLENGGVYAVPNLRGGGEYGEAWHKAGTGVHKQNVFDDFAAAARTLVSLGYTAPQRLGIGGGSNGGLLVGASITQQPNLFTAAICMVGVLDMLRFHRFTIGWAWKDDYGNPEVEADFHVLRAYSPLHNLRVGTHYPATLILTGDHDDRVVPAHSYKFGAALQEAQGGEAPILLRVDVRAGHGAGKPTAMLVEEEADKWAFLARVLGLPA